MLNAQTWFLAFVFWLHLVATVVWVGGLALLALVVWPGARAALGPGPALAGLLAHLQKRFSPLAWLSLAVLTVTGLIQMSVNPNYAGTLAIANPWALAILLKHLAVGGMVLVGGYLQWGLQPELTRLAWQEARGQSKPELQALRQRELVLTRLSLAGGVLVLAFTALARVL